MKVGELKPLSDEQKAGIKKADQERKRLVQIVQENHQSRPYNKRGKNK
jgi:hypothetical protein